MGQLQQLVGQTDIYLLDQIMKGRYLPGERILDAGCGGGRNLSWFLAEGFRVYGTDSSAAAIEALRTGLGLPGKRWRVEAVEALSFPDRYFDHVISSAVLHFAADTDHFFAMMGQMVRVLRPGGSLFVRMASDIGIEQGVVPAGSGVYLLPDGSTRFLLTRALLQQVLTQYPVALLEPFKTVNVADLRSMATLVLAKTSQTQPVFTPC